MADADHIYSEDQCGLIEGPFTVQRSKWVRSLEKRWARLRRRFCKSSARLRERIVEYPLTLAAMAALPENSRIADVGGASSLLGLELTYLGHEVHVLDLRPYPMRHAKLTSHQLDLLSNDFPNDYFNAISCISVIEHAGLERYGGHGRPDGDLAFIQELRRLCQTDGLIILSAPYGQGHDPSTHGEPKGFRIYDKARLEKLLQGFDVKSLRFFVMDNGHWLEKNQQAADLVPTSRPIRAIFFALLGPADKGKTP